MTPAAIAFGGLPWTPSLALLSAIVFLDAFKPSEPFLVPYLRHSKRFTERQVLHDIFPVLVYANLAAAALLPLAVQALGVRACVRCAAAARVATRVLLIVGRSVASMQAAEVCFGVVMAGDVLFDSFVYNLVPPSHFVRGSALVATLPLLATVASAELGELCRALGLPLQGLFWISLGAVGAAAALTMWLPEADDSAQDVLQGVGHPGDDSELTQLASAESMYTAERPSSCVHVLATPSPDAAPPVAQAHVITEDGATPPETPVHVITPEATRAARIHDTASRGGPDIPPRSSQGLGAWLRGYGGAVCSSPLLATLVLWWIAMYNPVYIFAQSYETNLFDEIDAASEWNGHVVAAASLLSAAAAATAPAVARAAARRAFAFHAGLTAAAAAALLALAAARSLLPAYVLYGAAVATMRLQLCIVQASAAAELGGGRYAQLFAVNALASLTLQSLAQVGLQASDWSSAAQFRAVGGWAAALACAIAALGCFQGWKRVQSTKPRLEAQLSDTAVLPAAQQEHAEC